ncbi:hypothetical protein N7510_011316 [Penicillium lagena]|uniref:uncharacterized protein n=1 Tax=Penicillium lagena TaxID=94218 RepID=UPI00253FFB96|nr:uncharacterized protein N7510_011316 [Penicillium lagena]KAJ5601782.1 hypothetical protein N7510_011316 [Penicillium lagena]
MVLDALAEPVPPFLKDARRTLTESRDRDLRWRVECGDSDLKWATTLGRLGYPEFESKTPDPTSLVKELSRYADKEDSLDLRDFQGLFFSRYWSRKNSRHYSYRNAYYLLPGTTGSPESGFCASKGNPVAITLYDGEYSTMLADRFLVLCSSFFAAKSLEQAAEKVSQEAGCGLTLDDIETRAGILLHELMHISTHDRPRARSRSEHNGSMILKPLLTQ